jgi:tape measure domain-containing protein
VASNYAAATLQISLQGARAANAGLMSTGRAIKYVGRQAYETAGEMEVLHKRSWLMNQALFTLRRYAYAGTLALTAMGGIALKWGFSFNQTMSSASRALMPVMHNTQAVHAELSDLFQMAKYSPFRFQDLTTGFRTMYLAMRPLGISAKTVTQTMQAMVDSLAASGKTSESNLLRVSTALQHMAYQGRLTGYTVNQLARDGVPIFAALHKELGLSGDQIHRIATLGIPTAVVLAAINKYVESTPGYMHAARNQAKTLGGELTTLKDNISQTMGALTLGGFQKIQGGILPSINNMFDKVALAIKKNRTGKLTLGQFFNVAEQVYPWLKPIEMLVKTLFDFGKALLRFFLKVVWPPLKMVIIPTLFIVVGLLKALTAAMNFLSDHKTARILATFVVFFLTMEIGFAMIMVQLSKLRGLIEIFKFGKTLMTETEIANMTKWQKVVEKMGIRWRWWVGVYRVGVAKLVATRWWQVLSQGFILKDGKFAAMTPFEKILLRMRWAVLGTGRYVRDLGKSAGRMYEILRYGSVRGAGGRFVTLTNFEKAIRRIRTFMRYGLIPTIIETATQVWILTAAYYAQMVAMIRLKAATIVTMFVMSRFMTLMRRIAATSVYMWLAELGPVGWIIAAVITLIGVMVILYFKWRWFHNAVNDTFKFIKDHWRLLISILLGPFVPLVPITIVIMDHIKQIINWVKSLIGWVKNAIGWIAKLHPWHWITSAAGSVAGAIGLGGGGGTTVGTSGTGGRIPVTTQNQIAAAVTGKNAPLHITVHNHVHIDGKKVAESTAKHRLNAQARR